MAPENLNKTDPAITAEDTNAMERFGIVRVPVDYFWLGEFRYTNLKDAIAQAKRQERAG
jgi:hypothetical protein